jgi:rare lipoprotein A
MSKKYKILFLFILFVLGNELSFSDSLSTNNDLINTEPEVYEIASGTASYYAHKFNGRKTASGEIYNKELFTAAHSHYPFGTIVRVTNISNNKTVIVKVNDRKAVGNKHILDLSYNAAKELGILRIGISSVKTEVIKWGLK